MVLSWPLPGCRPDRLDDLFSPRALAELARMAGAAGGAAVLELGGHTLQAPAGGGRKQLDLLEGGVPPTGLHSLALLNGTFALRPGMGVAIVSKLQFVSTQPFAVSLKRIKITRPAPVGSARASRMAALGPGGGNIPMIAFTGDVSGRMVQCRVELCPAGPAGHSALQAAVGVLAEHGARVVLEDVDVVARQGASSSLANACLASTGARLELNRCARGGGTWHTPSVGAWAAGCDWSSYRQSMKWEPSEWDARCRLGTVSWLRSVSRGGLPCRTTIYHVFFNASLVACLTLQP